MALGGAPLDSYDTRNVSLGDLYPMVERIKPHLESQQIQELTINLAVQVCMLNQSVYLIPIKIHSPGTW